MKEGGVADWALGIGCAAALAVPFLPLVPVLAIAGASIGFGCLVGKVVVGDRNKRAAAVDRAGQIGSDMAMRRD